MKKNVVFCCSLFVLSVGLCRAEGQEESSDSSSFFPTIEVSSDTNNTYANTPAEPPVDNLQDLHFADVDSNGPLQPLPQTDYTEFSPLHVGESQSIPQIDAVPTTFEQQQEGQPALSFIIQFLPETLQKALPTVISQLSSSAMLQLQSLGPIIAAPFLVYKAWLNAQKVINKEEGKNRRAAKMAAYASAAFLLVVNGYQWLAQQQ